MMMNGSLQSCKPLTSVANCEGKGKEERAEDRKRERTGVHQGAETVSELIGMILCRRPQRLRSYNRDHSLDNV